MTTTQTPVQFIQSLHRAARALDAGQPDQAGKNLARAILDAPTLDLRKLCENALMEAQLGLPERAEFYIAKALGIVEIMPVKGDFKPCRYCGDMSHEADGPSLTCIEKLLTDKLMLMQALEKIMNDPYTTCKCSEIARAAIKECEVEK